MSAALVPMAAPAIKPHYRMSRIECLEELKSATSLSDTEGTEIDLKELTVEELRYMVREYRVEQGTFKGQERKICKSEFSQKVSKARLPELKKMCDEKHITYGPTTQVAELRLRLRRWEENFGQAESGQAESDQPSASTTRQPSEQA